MNWSQADYLMKMIKQNYRDINEEEYQELKKIIENAGKRAFDDIFKRAFAHFDK